MKKIGKWITGVIIVAWAVASMGAMFYLAQQKEYSLVAVLAGQFLLILGLGSMFTTVVKNNRFHIKEQVGSLMSSVVGIGILCGGIVYPYYEEKEAGVFFLQGISLVLFAVMITIGVGTFVTVGIQHKKQKEKCTYALQVRCVKVHQRRDHYTGNGRRKYRTVYCPVYVGRYQGKEYTFCNNIYTNYKVPSVGEEYVLQIDPKNPEEYTDPRNGMTKILMILLSIGIFAGGIMGFLSSLWNFFFL